MEDLLKDMRDDIDIIDMQLVALFLKRLKVVEDIAKYKTANEIPLVSVDREKEVISKATLYVKSENKAFVEDFMTFLMDKSKEKQKLTAKNLE